MQQVNLTTRVYFHGARYIPFLKNPKYGEYPLKQEGEYKFFDVPTPYAKSLIEGTPAMFSAEPKTLVEIPFNKMDDDNLINYAQARKINVIGLSRENIISKLIVLTKKEKPEQKVDALKEVVEEKKEKKEHDLDTLKAIAKENNISHHPNIGFDKLQEKLSAEKLI